MNAISEFLCFFGSTDQKLNDAFDNVRTIGLCRMNSGCDDSYLLVLFIILFMIGDMKERHVETAEGSSECQLSDKR